jgi:hypothetical protein
MLLSLPWLPCANYVRLAIPVLLLLMLLLVVL